MLRIALPVRVPSLVVLMIWMCLFSSRAFAAGPNSANLTVTIVDNSHAYVADASSVVLNTATGVKHESRSNKNGTASFPFLAPGKYTVLVHKDGFANVAVDGIVLNVGDDKTIELTLQIGLQSETVTVNGDQLTINTTDGSVSSVIDRKFVENTPLNGRSFQSLILLTPGSVTNSPQSGSSIGTKGEFSINGQRTESNYYTVDGVSANTGITPIGSPSGAGAGGSLPASSASGTTLALVSVDALQEFRVESSTYSAEYGRTPGGQFAMVTRSGTNDWHGSAFDYLRNDALDANNWFNNNTVPITTKSPERQNDFGGTFGGPVRIPYSYNGRNRSFFFFSYEGLRLVQPVAANVNYVPTLALRKSVTGPLQQALNAFPLPSANAPDLGNGLSEFIGSWSTPTNADSSSFRLDHNIGENIHLFFRFSDAPSSIATRGTAPTALAPSSITSSVYQAYTSTFGATAHVTHSVDNDIRLNFTSNDAQSRGSNDNIGGAAPVDMNALQGISENASTSVLLRFAGYTSTSVGASNSFGRQQQWNLVDTVSIERSHHTIKAGVDWRRLTPTLLEPSTVQYQYTSAAAVTANSVSTGYGYSRNTAYPEYTNFSAFVQDAWKLNSRLNLSLGLRWELNPPPGISQGLMPYTVTGLNNYATLSLAPQGTPLWRTTWYNFAPRLGVAYIANANAGWETVVRAGGGVFFDTGDQTGSYAFQGPGFLATNTFGSTVGKPASFPAPLATVSPSIPQPPAAPYSVYTSPPDLQLPYSFQWNLSLEQALGHSESLTVSYVGSNGRKLLEEQYSNISKINPQFTTLFLFTNALTSSYNALQVKFQRQVTHGLQAFASYTWSHSLDDGSYNGGFAYQRGNSDFDVRNNATAAVSYEIPHSRTSPLLAVLSSDWGIDGRFTVRGGFPVTLEGNEVTDPTTGQIYYGGLNRVPTAPLFVYGSHSTYPGGKRINPAAFSLPATNVYGNAPRNFLDGFGALQADIAIRRSFPIHDRVQGQFRAESFNVFNHPIFGLVNTTYGGVQFGEATATLSQSLGTLSPLYQTGGPRSLQVSFKITF